MTSTPPTVHNIGHKPFLPNHEEDHEAPYSTPIFRQVAGRTTSFSSSHSSDSSSSLSFNEEYNMTCPPLSPITHLKFKGIPFSWEKTPGIPKNHSFNKKEYTEHLLPLPPAGTTNSCSTSSRFQKDPFLAALVECSKDDHHETTLGTILKGSSNKVSRALSERFGFINMYVSSCKRTCAVSESIVHRPRPRRPHYLVSRRRG